MFFEGSVKGLNEGSPVNFRGVKIGSVTELKFDPKDLVFLIPVYVEIDRRVTGSRSSLEVQRFGRNLSKRDLGHSLSCRAL